MAKLTRKLWVGIGAATIAGASVAAGAVAQDAHKGHQAGRAGRRQGCGDQDPATGRRGLPHRRRPARHAHPLLPRHRPDARPSPGRRAADRAGAVGRGAAALPAPHRRALRRDGEVHQAAQHPPLQPRAAGAGPDREGQAQGRLRAGAEGGRPAPRGRARGGAEVHDAAAGLHREVRRRGAEGGAERVRDRRSRTAASPSRSSIRTAAASSGRPSA